MVPAALSVRALDIDRQIRVLGAYAALTYPFACIPFLWFYFQDFGIGIDGYANLIACYYLTMVVAEVPTGLLADRFGRKLTLVLGPSVLAGGFLTIWLGDGFAEFALGEVLLGLGHSLLSGPPSALLYDSLSQVGAQHRFLPTEAGLHARRTLGTGGAFLAGGVLAASVDLASTILLTAVLCVVAALIALGLLEPPRQRTRTPLLLSNALRELRQPAVRWIAAYYVVVFCLLRYCFHTYQPYLQEAGQQRPLLLGVMFCALSIAAAPWSRAAPWLLRRFGEGALLWWMPLSMALSLVVMAFAVGWVGVALFFVHQAPFGAHWAIIQAYANHRLTSQSRATAMSMLSFAGRVVFAVLFPTLGYLHAAAGLSTTYIVAGSLGLVATWMVMRRQPR